MRCDLLLEAALLVLVALDLLDDRLEASDLFLGLADLLVEVAAAGCDRTRHIVADVDQAEGHAPDEQEVVELGARRKRRPLLLGGRRPGLGEEVDPDQAASSPMCRIASPTATARLGALSVSHSPETDAPAMSIWRNGFRISTGMLNRSFSCESRLTTREEPPEMKIWSIFSVEVVARKKSKVFWSSWARSSETDRRIGRMSWSDWSPGLLALLQGLGLVEGRATAASGSRRCTGCRRRRCRARRSCSTPERMLTLVTEAPMLTSATTRPGSTG